MADLNGGEETGQQYLEKHQIAVYLNEAVAQLLDSGEAERPLDSVARFFRDTLRGAHVVMRPYDFARATPHNRRSLAHVLRHVLLDPARSTALAAGARETPLLGPADFHEACRLVCPDFPEAVVGRACALVGLCWWGDG
jgi:hypothetical protein